MTAAPARPMTAEERMLLSALERPDRFARQVLRHDLWQMQATVLNAVATFPRVAVKACHASSKTFTAAEAVLWWITKYKNGIAITTAATGKQVKKLLWGEIHKAVASSLLAYPPLNQVELRLGPDNYAFGFSTNEGVNFQGFHGRILVVMDEAPGIDPAIWEAIEGIRAGGNVHILALGNPVIASGPFYDAFTKTRSGWHCLTISAFDTPNLQGLTIEGLLEMERSRPELLNVSVRDYLTLRQWVVEKWHEWGPKHPLWQSRVMGAFPRQAEDALLSLDWIEQSRTDARAVAKPKQPDEPYVAGIDVAGEGEANTVLEIRQANRTVFHKRYPEPDPRGAVLLDLAPYVGRLEAVNIDSIGIGYNFARHFEDQGLPVVDVNVGLPSDMPERFANLKAQYYWGLRDRYEQGDIVDPELDDETIGQLAGIRYKPTPRGQIRIESKEELAARGVKSPDDAEAKMLCYAPTTRWRVW